MVVVGQVLVVVQSGLGHVPVCSQVGGLGQELVALQSAGGQEFVSWQFGGGVEPCGTEKAMLSLGGVMEPMKLEPRL